MSCCVYAYAVVSANRKRERSPVDVGLSEYEKTELGVSFLSFFFWGEELEIKG